MRDELIMVVQEKETEIWLKQVQLSRTQKEVQETFERTLQNMK